MAGPPTPTLPSFALLVQNYPKGSVQQIKKLIGGGLIDDSIQDTCAARMSRALNYSGCHCIGTIPDSTWCEAGTTNGMLYGCKS